MTDPIVVLLLAGIGLVAYWLVSDDDQPPTEE